MSAFIPSNMLVLDQKGNYRKVKYVENRGRWPNGKYGLDRYYESHLASFVLIEEKEINEIPKKEETEDVIALYNKVFNK
jgi:hypothetical protein